MRIAYGVCTWGLGHAGRSLPFIRALLEEGHEVTVISSGRALAMLRTELSGGAGEPCGPVDFVDLPDYPEPYLSEGGLLMARFVSLLPAFVRAMYVEHEAFLRHQSRRRFDLIVSDNRYGIYDIHTPSFLITHQLRLLNPFGSRYLERGTEVFNLFFLKRFRGVMVPDFGTRENLAGRLCHGLDVIDERGVDYIGPVSEYSRTGRTRDIALFVSISGPEPQRTVFQKTLLSRLPALHKTIGGRFVVSLGLSGGRVPIVPVMTGHDLTVIPYLRKAERGEVLDRSRMVVARAGYSTIMDLRIVGGRALLVPTPGQTEQEYLGRYLHERGAIRSVSQRELDLMKDIPLAMRTHGFEPLENPGRTVKAFLSALGNRAPRF